VTVLLRGWGRWAWEAVLSRTELRVDTDMGLNSLTYVDGIAATGMLHHGLIRCTDAV
jgi:hypothetical protein